MTSLTRGANAPIDDTNVTIDVAGASPGSVDLLVFQLVGGKVRSDADMIFFNQPVSANGGAPDRVSWLADRRAAGGVNCGIPSTISTVHWSGVGPVQNLGGSTIEWW